MSPYLNSTSTRRVQPSYALPTVMGQTPRTFKVTTNRNPGNGSLVDAALGRDCGEKARKRKLFARGAATVSLANCASHRFNQYVPVFMQSLRATY